MSNVQGYKENGTCVSHFDKRLIPICQISGTLSNK